MAMTTLHAWPSRQKSRGLIGYSRYNVNYKKLFLRLPLEISVNLARAESQVIILVMYSVKIIITSHLILNVCQSPDIDNESYTYLLIAVTLRVYWRMSVFTLHSEHVVPQSLDSHSITSIKRLDQAI